MTARDDYEQLAAVALHHCRLYYEQALPVISDAEYDAMFAELEAIEAAHPEWTVAASPTQLVGAGVNPRLPCVTHRTKMLSLAKVHDGDELDAWHARMLRRMAAKSSVPERYPLSVEPKIDGFALELVYLDGILVQAGTRGDGAEGMNVTRNAREVHGVVNELRDSATMTIRGECFMAKADFDRINAGRSADDQYTSIAALAAGSIRLRDPAEFAARPLLFCAYEVVSGAPEGIETHSAAMEWLRGLGFIVTPHATTVTMGADLSAAVAELEAARASWDFPADGLVIKADRYDVREQLGNNKRSPRWAVAHKPRVETPAVAMEWRLAA